MPVCHIEFWKGLGVLLYGDTCVAELFLVELRHKEFV